MRIPAIRISKVLILRNFHKKLALCLIVVSVFSIICFAFSVGAKNNPSTGSNFKKGTVIVDAGHGGFDGGATVKNICEKDINLQISNSLAAYLKSFGFNVITVRSDDSSTESDPSATISARKKSDLRNRLELAKKNPDSIYVSIHLNKFPMESCKGAQIFYSPNNENSKILAECIRRSITEKLQKDNKRALKPGTRDTYLLYFSKIPTVIAECGFMSNSSDLNNLLNPGYQKQMAFSIACGILDYFKEV